MLNRDEAIAVATALAAAAAAAVLAIIVAAVLSTGQARSAADPAPGCAEWTDGCVICQRGPDGPACSTPGIACTRGALQCTRRL